MKYSTSEYSPYSSGQSNLQSSLHPQEHKGIPNYSTVPNKIIGSQKQSFQASNPSSALSKSQEYTSITDCDENKQMPWTPNSFHTNTDPNSYRVPIGVPMIPLYGYDNVEDSDKDWMYMRQMYPIGARKILSEIEEECDKLEYDGSCMFDEYPDQVYLNRMVDTIYLRVQYLEIEVATTGYHQNTMTAKQYNPDFYFDNRNGYPDYDHRHREPEHHRPPSNNPWLRNLIEIMLFQEFMNRRRRYRGRKRWF